MPISRLEKLRRDVERLDFVDTRGEHFLIDLDSAWRDTFAHWDALMPTDVACKIATAVEQALIDARG